jgi:hypothetical protein
MPCAYLLGTHKRPSQITILGISGGANRWLKIPLDLSRPAVTFARQVHSVARKTRIVPFFGPTIGYIVRYSADRTVRFDLKGDPVEVFDRAYSLGEVTIQVGGRGMPTEVFGRIVSLMPEVGAERVDGKFTDYPAAITSDCPRESGRSTCATGVRHGALICHGLL